MNIVLFDIWWEPHVHWGVNLFSINNRSLFFISRGIFSGYTVKLGFFTIVGA